MFRTSRVLLFAFFAWGFAGCASDGPWTTVNPPPGARMCANDHAQVELVCAPGVVMGGGQQSRWNKAIQEELDELKASHPPQGPARDYRIVVTVQRYDTKPEVDVSASERSDVALSAQLEVELPASRSKVLSTAVNAAAFTDGGKRADPEVAQMLAAAAADYGK